MVDLRDKFPVMLTFDVDGETLWLNRDPKNAERPVTLSMGRYGPVTGVPKIARLLERYGILATFFVPGWIADHYPDMVRSLVAGGHEIGHHGYRHEWLTTLDPGEEEPILLRGIEALEKAGGARPVGYRAPAWELTPRSLGLLERHGFAYSSNMMDTDAPYRHRIEGRPSRLVELPVAWTLDDTSMYLFSLQIPGSKLMANEQVLSMWCGEFDGLYADGGACVLTCHPQITGRSYRLAALEHFIQHVRRRADVAFLRCIDAAEYFRDTLPEPAPAKEARP
jgi:peptidoglycan/xylan/chitin deacetylase (PgdA/CDA1 family)